MGIYVRGDTDIKGQTDVRGGSEVRGDTELKGHTDARKDFYANWGIDVRGLCCRRGY